MVSILLRYARPRGGRNWHVVGRIIGISTLTPQTLCGLLLIGQGNSFTETPGRVCPQCRRELEAL